MTQSIKETRLKANMTQSEFSQKNRIPLKTLQNWESKEGTKSHRPCPTYVESIMEKVN